MMAAGNVRYGNKSPGLAATAELGRFFRWWRDELAALIPAGLRPLPRPVEKFTWLKFGAERAQLLRVRAGRVEEVGAVDLYAPDAAARRLAFDALLSKKRTQPMGIVLPAESVVHREADFPLAVAENLRQVVGFEMSRLTPFTADHCYFDYRELGRNASTIHIRLVYTERKIVDRGIHYLQEWGREVHAVVPEGELVAETRYANLLPPEQRPGMPGLAKLGYGLMVLVTLALLGAALAIPLWEKREIAIALDKQATLARSQAEAVEALQNTLEASQSEYGFLLNRKLTHPTMVAAIEELTHLMPDDVWLTTLEIKGNQVTVNGMAQSSASLIRTVGQSKLLDDASFSSPVVKERNNLERFQIAAKLKEVDPDQAAVTPAPEKPAASVPQKKAIPPKASKAEGGGKK